MNHLQSQYRVFGHRCWAALAMILLLGCETVDQPTTSPADGDMDRLAPPSFTRGLLTRFEPQPLYPLRALNQRVEGWVMLHFDVDEDGEVIPASLEIEDEQPGGYFTQSALSAARRLSFENTRGGVVEDIHYVFRYELQEQQGSSAGAPQTEPSFRELIPDSFITPAYPEAAERAGIEGYVVVAFTVSRSGGVENLRIVESTPPGVFDEAALRAGARLRFEPRLVSGEPVAVDDVEYRFDWNLRR